MEKRNPRKRKAPLIHLPHDVLQDVLLRLPVKSLVRFKCVCRSWFSLISSNKFAKLHLAEATENCSKYGIIESVNLPYPYLSLHSLVPDGDGFVREVANLDFPFENLDYVSSTQVDIYGSCNGLLLLALGRKKLVLWNPTTREHKLIPQYPVEHLSYQYSIAGLGYDATASNYKVIVMVIINLTPELTITRGGIYSLKTNSWAKINFPYRFPSHKPGTAVVNGNPHWFLHPQGLHQKGIVSFDMVKDKFKELPSPPTQQSDDSSSNSRISLGVWEACLCASRHDNMDIEIWSMKEYGVKASWAKLMVFPVEAFDHWMKPWTRIMPLHVTRKGEVLVDINWKRMAIYDPMAEEHKVVFFSGREEGPRVTSYEESLVSPNQWDAPRRLRDRSRRNDRVNWYVVSG